MIRSATIQVNDMGQPIAEIDPRVAVCHECWIEITGDRRDLPPARVIRRFDRKAEP
jgi:hypothetical protein